MFQKLLPNTKIEKNSLSKNIYYNITINKIPVQYNSEKLTTEGLERSESGTGLKNSEEFTHPPHNPCFKKKEGGKMGEGEGRGDVMPFIDCPKSNKPN